MKFQLWVCAQDLEEVHVFKGEPEASEYVIGFNPQLIELDSVAVLLRGNRFSDEEVDTLIEDIKEELSKKVKESLDT